VRGSPRAQSSERELACDTTVAQELAVSWSVEGCEEMAELTFTYGTMAAGKSNARSFSSVGN